MQKVPFSMYQDSIKKLKNMSYNNFNKWVLSIWDYAYKDGYSEAMTSCYDDVISEISDEDLLEVLLSVKGIGRRRAEEAVEKITNWGMRTDKNE